VERGFALFREAVVAVARVAVVRSADFLDPARIEQALDGGIKRRRAYLDAAIGKLTCVLHDRAAMLVTGS